MTQTFSEQEIRERLNRDLPQWHLQDNQLTRVYKTGGWQLTMMTANAIAFLAEDGFHHPELVLNYPSVEVHLQTHDAGGITKKDFELARKIEEVVTWYPAEDDALDGKPRDEWLQ